MTYDPFVGTIPDPTAIAVDGFTSVVLAAYTPVTAARSIGFIVLGNNCYNPGACGVRIGLQEFVLGFRTGGDGSVIPDASDAFFYSLPGADSIYNADRLLVTREGSPVPEPAALALLALPLGLAGAIVARRLRDAGAA